MRQIGRYVKLEMWQIGDNIVKAVTMADIVEVDTVQALPCRPTPLQIEHTQQEEEGTFADTLLTFYVAGLIIALAWWAHGVLF